MMTGAKLQKLLFRIYINWAITLLILFIPKLMRNAKEHVAQAGEFAFMGQQKTEFADSLAADAVNYASRDWCEKKARQLEQETDEAAAKSRLCGETPANYRTAAWCEERSRTFKQLSESTNVEARDCERRAARYARWANALALLDILPFWTLGAIMPWIIHFAVARLLRRSENGTLRPGSSPPGKEDCED